MDAASAQRRPCSAQGVESGRAFGVALTIFALCLALLLALAAPSRADAKVPRGAIKALVKADCPPNYAVRVNRSYKPEEIAAAKDGVFRIEGQDVRITRPMNWNFDPVGSLDFQARLNDLRWLDVLFYAYRENDDLAALRQAKTIVVDWVKQNPRKSPINARTWFDKVVGDRSPYVAYALRAGFCERMINRKLARNLLDSVNKHGSFLAKPAIYSDTNRGLFMDLGLVFTGRQVPFLQKAGKWRKRGQGRFVQNIQRHTIFGEGFWLEHSTTYQFLVINILERFLEVDHKDRPLLDKLLSQMHEIAGWLTMPDKRWLQAGNSYQEESDGFAKKIAGDLGGLKTLPESGLAFVRRKHQYLSFLANFHSSTHKHSDELSFDLFEKDTRLISDTGLFTKDPGPRYDFAQSAIAHNVLTVDGLEFPRSDSDAYGSGLLATGEGDGWFGMLGRNPLLDRLGVDHRRLLLYRPTFGLIVADRIRSERSHSYRRYLHFGPQLDLQYLPDKLRLTGNGAEISVFSQSTVPEQERRVEKGRDDPFQGFVFPGFQDQEQRWSSWFTTEGSNVDSVISIALNPNREARAAAQGPLGDQVGFDVFENGELTRIVNVTRNEGTLAITQEELDYKEPNG